MPMKAIRVADRTTGIEKLTTVSDKAKEEEFHQLATEAERTIDETKALIGGNSNE